MARTVILYSVIILLVSISVGLAITTQQKTDQITGFLAGNTEGGHGLKFSDFDRQLAIEMMDKNSDGKCDACGMPVGMCIDSGQMECSMVPGSKIGVLGSGHTHADWKIYIGGKPLDLSRYSHMERMQQGLSVSSFIHVDSGSPPPEKTGDVLHMHATGVPLWVFFKSIGLGLPASARAYVNGKEIRDYQNYAFKDLDKILITDGIGDLQEQLGSITNFAGNH